MGQFHDELPNLGEEWRHVALEAVVDDDGEVARHHAVLVERLDRVLALGDSAKI